MIDRLRLGTSANFYKLARRLSASAISDLFRQLRATAQSPSQNLFRHVRDRTNGTTWSAICFFHDHEPGFLRPLPRGQAERTCGYVLLVEHRQHLAVFKSGLELPSAFKTRYLQRIAYERIEAATAQQDAILRKSDCAT